MARAFDRRSLGAVGVLGLLLTGCGLGAGSAPTGVRITVTKEFGTHLVSSSSSPHVRGQETVMSLLMRNNKVNTLYGGGFVQNINGYSGGTQRGEPQDWFYYVNGVQAPKGAAETNVNSGDRIWWDLHDWSQAEGVPAVVGSYPEPFRHGTEGRRLPVRIECQQTTSAPCQTVNTRLQQVGVPAALSSIDPGEYTSTLRVLVGTWTAVRGTPATQAIERGPRASGVYVRLTPSGHTLTLLDGRGQPTRTLGAGAGLVAAIQYGKEAPEWVITGTDAAGVALAADALSERALRNHFALALEPSGTGLPVPTASP
ncbi:MAG: DUF4430 domain-containing protein [Solirubrobacteraceae bacterium]